jgi:transposase
VVARLGRKGRRWKLRGKRGRGTLEGERPPVLGLLQRTGEVVIQMLPNVQHVTIQPIITDTVASGSMIYTDEYDIYDTLPRWGFQHKSVNHAAGEYARMKMGMDFMKCMSTPMKASGRCSVPGCVPLVASLRKNCPGTWAFSSSSTMFAVVAKRCFTRCWLR